MPFRGHSRRDKVAFTSAASDTSKNSSFFKRHYKHELKKRGEKHIPQENKGTDNGIELKSFPKKFP